MTGLAPLFAPRSPVRWLLLFLFCLYCAFCWVDYTFSVEPLYGAMVPPSIAADSLAYFQIAGLGDNQEIDASGLAGYGGSPLGPVTIALIGRNTLGVACVNCALFLLTLYWAGLIPGVRREIFALIMALDAQTLPTLMTLNKEILAISAMVAFAAYIYPDPASGSRRHSKLLLVAGILLSILARWEQAAILIWYLIADSQRWPFRGKPRRAVAVLLLVCSIAYALAVNVLHINLGGFVSQIEGGGLIVRLYSIQEKGGYFLVALPKILMNIAGRWVTPSYFFGEYWTTSFGSSDWQNAYIGPLSSLFMSAVIAFAFLRGRFRLSRPLIHLAVAYFIFTTINPFIQPRYMYPGFAILALELSRRRASLEPVLELPKLPSLPESYKALQAQGEIFPARH